MSQISDKILETIKDQGLKPTPKSNLRAKNLLLWFLFGLSIIFGALAVGISIFILANQEWDIYQRIEMNFGKILLLTLPYFWLAALVVFVGLGYYNYKNTKFGYRLPLARLIIFYLLATVILGILIYNFGLGYKLNNIFNEKLPGYAQLNYEHRLWQKTDQGLLAGEIVAITKNGFILQDLSGDHWQINALTANVQNDAILKIGERIKIIGDITLENQFTAEEIRPWCGCGGCLKPKNCDGNCQH
ncbi:hypothetical protein GYA54_00895 [Candidatus Kuenenbacteria bacterium]|nr:hypothetical protein [Candidatus Kuenenbacteria bacterium]